MTFLIERLPSNVSMVFKSLEENFEKGFVSLQIQLAKSVKKNVTLHPQTNI